MSTLSIDMKSKWMGLVYVDNRHHILPHVTKFKLEKTRISNNRTLFYVHISIIYWCFPLRNTVVCVFFPYHRIYPHRKGSYL